MTDPEDQTFKETFAQQRERDRQSQPSFNAQWTEALARQEQQRECGSLFTRPLSLAAFAALILLSLFLANEQSPPAELGFEEDFTLAMQEIESVPTDSLIDYSEPEDSDALSFEQATSLGTLASLDFGDDEAQALSTDFLLDYAQLELSSFSLQPDTLQL